MKPDTEFQIGFVRRRSFSGWLEEIPGLVCGPFGISHSQVIVNGQRVTLSHAYTITHMPSGYAVRTRIETQREAKRLVRELRALKISWRFRNPDRLKKAVLAQIAATVQ